VSAKEFAGTTALRKPTIARNVWLVRFSVCDSVEHEGRVSTENQAVDFWRDDSLCFGARKQQNHLSRFEHMTALELGSGNGSILIYLARHHDRLDAGRAQGRQTCGGGRRKKEAHGL
jgi:hypothetical protein